MIIESLSMGLALAAAVKIVILAPRQQSRHVVNIDLSKCHGATIHRTFITSRISLSDSPMNDSLWWTVGGFARLSKLTNVSVCNVSTGFGLCSSTWFMDKL